METSRVQGVSICIFPSLNHKRVVLQDNAIYHDSYHGRRLKIIQGEGGGWFVASESSIAGWVTTHRISDNGDCFRLANGTHDEGIDLAALEVIFGLSY